MNEYNLPQMVGVTASKLTAGERDAIECLIRKVWADTWGSAVAYRDGDDRKEAEFSDKILESFKELKRMGFNVA